MCAYNNDSSEDKKRVLITGASKGIGRAIALELAEAGYELILHYGKSKDAAEKVLNEVTAKGGKASLLQFDVKNREEVKTKLLSDIETNGAYYGVISNAGITKDNAFPSLSGDDWDDVINTNLNGFYNVVNPVVLPMVQARKGGRIIAMSSVSGIMGNRGQANYSASKAGLIGAVKSLAIELAKRKITVNCVAPGLIETDMIKDSIVPIEEIEKSIPLRRAGKPEEVAYAVKFLLSDEAAYITRQVLSVNGGLI